LPTISRRRFSSMFGVMSAASLVLPPAVLGQSRPRVVVVGGGAGGATAARYLAEGSGSKLDVILIEESENYTSCFYSNLYLGGIRTYESITHNYSKLVSDYGVTMKQGRAVEVDRQARTVVMKDGTRVAYDRLILSPGIELKYDSVPGYTEADSQIAPHAWQGGAQTELLKQKLDALENGQDIIMVAPPNPYRCPPGPYERVSMMAHTIKQRGFTDSRIYIIDPKPSFSKQGLFSEGWVTYYPDIIEWFAPEVHGGIVEVDSKAGTVETDLDTFEGALLNIIPAQKAGAIAATAGLTDGTGFCQIDADSMRSVVDANIFVIGDASIAGAMPKSAFSANSQAKVAAMTIRADLLSSQQRPARYSNVCWSLIATDDSVKVGATYAPNDDGTIDSTSTFISQNGEEANIRKATYEESANWYASIVADMFG